MMGICDRTRDTEEPATSLSLSCEDTEKVTFGKSERKLSPETHHVPTYIFDNQPPELREKIFIVLFTQSMIICYYSLS